MFWIILIIVVIAIFVYIKKDIEKDEQRKKNEAEKARKEKEKVLFLEKRKKIYQSSLSSIYDDLPDEQLKTIYSLLNIMCNNDYDVAEDGFTKQTCEAYYDAKEALLLIVGHNRWKWLLSNGKIEWIGCMMPVEDLNYVYRLLNYRR